MTASSSSECPSSTVLARYVRGEAELADRGLIADHLVGCTRCLAATRMAEQLRPYSLDLALDIDLARGHPSTRQPQMWVSPFALGIALGVGLIGSLALLLYVIEPATVERSGRHRIDERLVEPPPEARLAEPPEFLHVLWAKGPAAVEIRDDGAQLLWQGQSDANGRVVLPAGLRAQLRGRDFQWRARVGEQRAGPYWVLALPSIHDSPSPALDH